MLPKNLLYQNKLAAAPANAYSTLISPNNGNGPYPYDSTASTIIINIPTGGNRVLNPSDSYLKFRINVSVSVAENKTMNYLRLGAGGGHCIFQRLRLFHTGLLEDIDDYALLSSKLLVHTCPADAYAGRQNVMLGTSAAAGVTYGAEVVACPAGIRVNGISAITGANPAVGATYTTDVCISLMSIIGSLTDKYIPLFEMGAAPLRLELTTVNNKYKVWNTNDAFITAGTATNFISNVEFCAAFIDLSDTTIAQLRGSTMGAPMQMVVPAYRTYSTTLNVNASGNAPPTAGSPTTQTVIIPARYSSLKSVYVTMQDKSEGGAGFYANATPHFNLSEYSFRVGSQIFPSKKPTTYPEFLAELAKALGTFNDYSSQGLVNANTLLSVGSLYGKENGVSVANTEQPLLDTTNTTSQTRNISCKEQSFMVGIDLEAYSGADRSAIFTGFNTLTTDIQFNPIHATVNNANGAPLPVKYTAFALFDQVLAFENGVCVASY